MTPLRVLRPSCLTAVIGTALIVASAPPLSGHKPVTSKYTYTQDVFPIVRQRCAPCHVRDGPSPMSLMTYQDAVPWAESMREELTAERMPPWFVDPLGPRVLGAHTLSAQELDVLLTWASGGAPEGQPDETMPDIAPASEWRGGMPDLTLSIPQVHTLPPNIEEDVHEFLVPTGLTKDTWVSGVDLRPGTPSLVRSATIGVQGGPVLAVWLPGQDHVRTPAGTGFNVAANAVLTVRIRYRKPWQMAQNAVLDQSTVGLYFTSAPESVAPIRTHTFSGARMDLQGAERILAVRLTLDRPYDQAEVKARRADGSVVTLLSVRKPRPEWMTRYWLAEPVQLPQGSTMEVTVTPATGSPEVEICGTLPSK